MKKLSSIVWSACLCLIVVGCASPRQSADAPPLFRDGSSANVILRFASWEYTFLVKPFYAEDGYMQQVQRESIGQVFDKFSVRRDMAVVVVGVQYQGEQLQQLVSDWKTILNGCGFHRIVILRAKFGKELNGSVIVDDSRRSDFAHNAF